MKKIFILSFLCILVLNCIAKTCRISGTLLFGQGVPVRLILLQGDGYYSSPSVPVYLGDGGRFTLTINIGQPVFALLKTDDWQQRILLSPDSNIEIYYNDEKGVRFSGQAAVENRILSQIVLDSLPLIMRQSNPNNLFVKFEDGVWKEKLVIPIEQELSSSLKLINAAAIPKSLKQLLGSELQYAFQSHLYNFAQNHLRWKKHNDRDAILAWWVGWQPVPDSAQLVSGFYANLQLQNYSQYQLFQQRAKPLANGETREQMFQKFFQTPASTIEALIKEYGERYLISWLYARIHLPVSVQDKVLFNKLLDAIENTDLNTAYTLYDTLANRFPHSRYLTVAAEQVKQIREALARGSKNTRIKYRDSASVKNLKELLSPYEGKLVYLDIWGTWCGPCRAEMKFVPALKEQFKEKKIVFLYLDMDPLQKNQSWKSYVEFYEIEGEHYRMDEKEIQPIWDEIEKAGGRSGFYPGYVLFDKTGKIVNASAPRPSDREKLYKLLNKHLSE